MQRKVKKIISLQKDLESDAHERFFQPCLEAGERVVGSLERRRRSPGSEMFGENWDEGCVVHSAVQSFFFDI